MSELSELVKVGWDPKEIESIVGLSAYSNEFPKAAEKLISECCDIEILKQAAIAFDEVPAFYPVEDRLVALIGDEYYDFAAENDLA